MKLRTVLLALCLGSMVCIAIALPAHSATRRVVLLFGERPELPGLSLLQAELVRTLASNSAVEVGSAGDNDGMISPGMQA